MVTRRQTGVCPGQRRVERRGGGEGVIMHGSVSGLWQCRGRGKQRKASDGYQGSSRASLVAVGGFLKIMSRTLFSPAPQGSDCRGASALQLCALNIANLGVNWPKVAEDVNISYI